mmetsp:Transcript_1400/g.1922  ORF Transcript_1400/g.1922 Transcript_1400/m.1922 type:complete len:96 (+) Transcript_1400:328-615(+)
MDVDLMHCGHAVFYDSSILKIMLSKEMLTACLFHGVKQVLAAGTLTRLELAKCFIQKTEHFCHGKRNVDVVDPASLFDSGVLASVNDPGVVKTIM